MAHVWWSEYNYLGVGSLSLPYLKEDVSDFCPCSGQLSNRPWNF